MKERRPAYFARIQAGLRATISRLARPRVGREAMISTPIGSDLSVIPNPTDDPDGYDRCWVLFFERESFYGGGDILTPTDLTPEVLAWARANYPGSYSTQAIRLHSIKDGWIRAQMAEELDGNQEWQELLNSNKWRQFVSPPSRHYK